MSDDKIARILALIKQGSMIQDAAKAEGMSRWSFWRLIKSRESTARAYRAAREEGELIRKKSFYLNRILTVAEKRSPMKAKEEGEEPPKRVIRNCSLCGNPIGPARKKYAFTDYGQRKPERFYFCSRSHIRQWGKVEEYSSFKSVKRLRAVLEYANAHGIAPSLSSLILYGNETRAGHTVAWLCERCPEHPLIEEYDNCSGRYTRHSFLLPPGWLHEVIVRVSLGFSMAESCRSVDQSDQSFSYWVRTSRAGDTSPWIYQEYDKAKGKK